MSTINNNKASGQRCTICDYFNDGSLEIKRDLRPDTDNTKSGFICGVCYASIKQTILEYDQDTFKDLDPSVKRRLWNVHHYPHNEEKIHPLDLEGIKRQYLWTTAGSRTKKPTLAPVRGLETEGDPLDRCLLCVPGAVDGDLGGGMGGSSQNE